MSAPRCLLLRFLRLSLSLSFCRGAFRLLRVILFSGCFFFSFFLLFFFFFFCFIECISNEAFAKRAYLTCWFLRRLIFRLVLNWKNFWYVRAPSETRNANSPLMGGFILGYWYGCFRNCYGRLALDGSFGSVHCHTGPSPPV